MSDLNPLTLGDNPEDLIELEDGSVEIMLEGEAPVGEAGDFLENLAEKLSAEELNLLGSELVEQVEKDKQSREKRDKQYEEGLRRSGLGDDAPGGAEFEGASKVVHPVLAEACVDFASRAIKELFPSSGPVKPWAVDDANSQQLEAAHHKAKFMNWQLTVQMKEYRDELEQLLTQVPMGGSQFQKFWYDERLRRPRSEFVPVDDIYLPYSATSFYTAIRATHRQLITQAEFEQRISSGLYRDIHDSGKPSSLPEESSASQANDKIEGRDDDGGYNEDGLRSVLEIYLWREFDDDSVSGGKYAPYIVTVDEYTQKTLSIYRNWAEGDPRMEKLDWFVEWKFIPWRGAYAIGLPHLIGGLSAALTGSLRALLDSAHINNSATMLKLKSGRVIGQSTEVNVTQVCEIEGPAGIDDVRKIAMPMPFNPPSPVLHQLMSDLYGLAKGVVATSEDALNNLGDRTPVGTTMALIEQGSQVYSSIHARLHASQRKALEILHRIDSQYLEEIVEFESVKISRDEFMGSINVIPVSDPTIFSEAQRFAQTQSLMQMSAADAQDPSIPWNKVAIRRRMLKQMRIDNIDELLPLPPEPITSDVLTENFEWLSGKGLKANPQQTHRSHVVGHLSFLENPLQFQNPMLPPQALGAMLAHVNEHLQFWQRQLIQEMIMSSGIPVDDSNLGQLLPEAEAMVQQQLQPFAQKLGELNQEVQKRMPPPQQPPEVQASLQIAQAENQRKAQYDQGMLQLRDKEISLKHEAELQSLNQSGASSQLSQQVELQKNQQDNQRKQLVEILKNRDDNLTKLNIALQELSQKSNSEVQAQVAELQRLMLTQEADQATQVSELITSILGGEHGLPIQP